MNQIRPYSFILLGDDTEELLELFNAYLCSAGYVVMTAQTRNLMEVLYFPGRYHLIIADDLDGGGVGWLNFLHHEHRQKVLCTSAAVLDPSIPSLPKPMTKEALLGKVSELLRTNQAAANQA